MTEEEIINSFKEGKNQEKALGALMDAYKKRLYYHIRRMLDDHDDTDDVLQNVFIKAWRALPNFRGESGLYTWLYRIATNESLTFINQRKKRQTLSLSEDDDEEYVNPIYKIKAETELNPNQIELKLQAAIQQLPDKQRAVFCLRYYDEMPYSEISEVLETSEGALKASYHHAVKKIQEILTGH